MRGKEVLFFLHSFGKIFKAVRILLNAPELNGKAGFFKSGKYFFGDLILYCADGRLCLGAFDTVDEILFGQHMRGRNHDGSQAVQGNRGEPVFIMTFQNDENTVSPADSGAEKYVCHLIAVSADVREGKDTLFIFRVAPYESFFLRRFFCQLVHRRRRRN